jgi:ribosomal protein L29
MSHADLSDEQVVHKVLQAERDLVANRFKHKTNTLENTSALRVIRREIARLRTEARRRERDGGLAKGALLSAHSGSFTRVSSGAVPPTEKGGFLSGIVDKLTGKE